jgi:hypothetical protein
MKRVAQVKLFIYLNASRMRVNQRTVAGSASMAGSGDNAVAGQERLP